MLWASYVSLRQSVNYLYRRINPDITLRCQLVHKLRVGEAYKAHTGRHKANTNTHSHRSTQNKTQKQTKHTGRESHKTHSHRSTRNTQREKHTQAHARTHKENSGTQTYTGTKSLTLFTAGNRLTTDHPVLRHIIILTMSLRLCRICTAVR